MEEDIYKEVLEYMSVKGLDYSDDIGFIRYLIKDRSDCDFTFQVIEESSKLLNESYCGDTSWKGEITTFIENV